MSFPVQRSPAVSGQGPILNVLSFSVVMPATVVVGDTLLVAIASDGAATFDPLNFSEPGWTEVASGTNGSVNRLSLFRKTATGTEGGTTVTFWISANEMAAWVAMCFAGDAISGLEVSAAVANATTSPDPPTIDPTWGTEDTAWLSVIGWDGNISVTGYPSGMSEVGTARIANPQGTGVAVTIANAFTAAYDPAPYTLSGIEQWVAYTIAIRGGSGPTSSLDVTTQDAVSYTPKSITRLTKVDIDRLDGTTIVFLGPTTQTLGTVTPSAPTGTINVIAASALGAAAGTHVYTITGSATTATGNAISSASGSSSNSRFGPIVATLDNATATGAIGLRMTGTGSATTGNATSVASGSQTASTIAGTIAVATASSICAASGLGGDPGTGWDVICSENDQAITTEAEVEITTEVSAGGTETLTPAVCSANAAAAAPTVSTGPITIAVGTYATVLSTAAPPDIGITGPTVLTPAVVTANAVATAPGITGSTTGYIEITTETDVPITTETDVSIAIETEVLLWAPDKITALAVATPPTVTSGATTVAVVPSASANATATVPVVVAVRSQSPAAITATAIAIPPAVVSPIVFAPSTVTAIASIQTLAMVPGIAVQVPAVASVLAQASAPSVGATTPAVLTLTPATITATASAPVVVSAISLEVQTLTALAMAFAPTIPSGIAPDAAVATAIATPPAVTTGAITVPVTVAVQVIARAYTPSVIGTNSVFAPTPALAVVTASAPELLVSARALVPAVITALATSAEPVVIRHTVVDASAPATITAVAIPPAITSPSANAIPVVSAIASATQPALIVSIPPLVPATVSVSAVAIPPTIVGQSTAFVPEVGLGLAAAIAPEISTGPRSISVTGLAAVVATASPVSIGGQGVTIQVPTVVTLASVIPIQWGRRADVEVDNDCTCFRAGRERWFFQANRVQGVR